MNVHNSSKQDDFHIYREFKWLKSWKPQPATHSQSTSVCSMLPFLPVSLDNVDKVYQNYYDHDGFVEDNW
jgi:hypothetical protein